MSRRIHYLLDPRWRAALGMAKRWAMLPCSLRLEAVSFRNKGANGEPGFDGLYVGEGLSTDYYLGLYGHARSDARAVSPTALRKTVLDAVRRVPLVVVEVNSLLRFLCPAGGWPSSPWVRHELDLQSERYRRRRRRIERNFGRVVRRHGYRFLTTQSLADVRRFYHEYYVPHVRARFGAEIPCRSLGQVERAVASGFLLQVFDGDHWISGIVGYRESAWRVQLVSAGLLPDRLGQWQDGALTAALYFAVEQALSTGIRYVDFGGTRPHLDDGVFHHKSLWGAEPFPESWHHTQTLFYVAGGSPLPRVAARQLVWCGRRFTTLASALRGAGELTRADHH